MFNDGLREHVGGALWRGVYDSASRAIPPAISRSFPVNRISPAAPTASVCFQTVAA